MHQMDVIAGIDLIKRCKRELYDFSSSTDTPEYSRNNPATKSL